MSGRRVLLISPPWHEPDRCSLGVVTVAQLLRRAGHTVDELYGTLLFPPTSGSPILRLQYSQFFFLPYLYDHMPASECAEAAADLYLFDVSLEGLRPDHGMDRPALVRDALQDIGNAGVCLERCVDHALDGGYDVIAMSATFETQLPAALTIANRIAQARPELPIVLGGAACFGETAEALLRRFDSLHAVCRCEADELLDPLIEGLAAGGGLGDVPGIAFRADSDVHVTPAPPLFTDLDSLPAPCYDRFTDQLARSGWFLRPTLYFETSRGCWWGQKHLCTFCGLNADGLTYRRKSPDRAVSEIRELHARYPSARRLDCTDNILDMGFITSVLPRLAGLGARMFWETKSNLKKAHIRALADAGVDAIQPGIESFDDEVLTLMDKGVTGLGQVQTIKWLTELGVEPIYNVLVRNPGEKAAHYRKMTRLIPFLTHLKPPTVVAMWLERFSPYFMTPERYGIRNVRARAYYERLYGLSAGAQLDGLAYVFDYDHDMRDDGELTDALREFVVAADAWRDNWQPGALFFTREGPDRVVADRRRVGHVALTRVSGRAGQLLAVLDAVRGRRAVARALDGLDPCLVDAQLAVMQRRRWVCNDGGRYLCVAPERASGGVAGVEVQPGEALAAVEDEAAHQVA